MGGGGKEKKEEEDNPDGESLGSGSMVGSANIFKSRDRPDLKTWS